jgi:hypothetical protein
VLRVGLAWWASQVSQLGWSSMVFFFIEKTNSPEDDDFEETLKRVQQVCFFKTTCRLQYA